MTHELSEAAERLAGVLRRENEALGAFDMHGAAGMLAEKQQAAAAFVAALPGTREPPGELALRLRDLAQENGRRLEHAMAVQRRILGIIARAVRGSVAAPRYGATGAMAAGRQVPFTLSARA